MILLDFIILMKYFIIHNSEKLYIIYYILEDLIHQGLLQNLKTKETIIKLDILIDSV